MPSSTPRPRRRDAEQNREQLICTASEVLRDNPTASLDEIARRAGLSRRGLYGHFASREELLGTLLQRGAARITERIGLIDDADPAVAIAGIAARIWEQVAPIRVSAALAMHDPYRNQVATSLEPLRARLREIIRRGIAAGQLPDGISAETTAVLIENTALGVLDAAARDLLDPAETLELIVLTGLGAAGLSRGEAREVFVRFRAHEATAAHETSHDAAEATATRPAPIPNGDSA